MADEANTRLARRRRRSLPKTGGIYVRWPEANSNAVSFSLDDEQRSRIRDCLRKDAIGLDSEAEQKLECKIELSIRAFLETRRNPEGKLRDAHEALRQLWFLAHKDDCGVGQLRARLNRLPRRAMDELDGRVHMIPRLFPGETAEQGFLAWARGADGKKLVGAVRALSAYGGQRVSRSRGGGKRSRPRLEPLILGQVRGAGGGRLKGGRPSRDAQDNLVMHLALDWNLVIGSGASSGRSDHRGFGDLVHSVFQWLDECSPDQALRRFWQRVEEGRSSLQEGTKLSA